MPCRPCGGWIASWSVCLVDLAPLEQGKVLALEVFPSLDILPPTGPGKGWLADGMGRRFAWTREIPAVL